MTGKPSPTNNSIFFLGDVLLQDDYWNSSPCSDTVTEFIQSKNLAIANLEAPVETDFPIEKFSTNLSLTTTTIPTLDQLGFDAVSLSNNHIRDYGSDGVVETTKECNKHGLKPFGVGTNSSDAISPLKYHIDGCSIAVFGLSEHRVSIATADRSGAGWIYEAQIYDRVEAASEEFDITIIVAHGGLEYIPIPPETWRSQLRSLAEVGADGIISHHPHTPQGWEVYKETPIFYSLGNFMMYNPERPSTHWSYGVNVNLNKSSENTFFPVLFSINDGKVHFMSDDEATTYESYLKKSSAIITDEESYHGYWQEIADRLFYNSNYRYQYHDRLTEYGVGHLRSLLSNPVLEIDRLTRGVTGTKANHEKAHAILDQLQCSSHIDAMRTALEVEAGILNDKRTQEQHRELDQLFEICDGTQNETFIEKQRNRVSTLLNRFR